MAHTGDIFINEDKEYIYLSDDDNNYYLIKDGNYHLVATYALASSISGFDPAGVANELITKNMVAEAGCKFKETTILPYNELPDTVCVLYEDLEADTDISLPGGEGGSAEGDYYNDNFYKFFYRTTNNEEITPIGSHDWYDGTGSEGNTFYYDVKKSDGGSIAIPDDAFSGKTTLKSVVTHCNISNTGNNGFLGCTNLTDVQIYGDGHLTINENSFSGCTSLKSVVFGSYWYLSMDNVDVGSGAFCGCTNLQHLQGQDNIRSIGAKAFCMCEKLDALTLINCDTYGPYAFSGCTGLTKIMMKGNAQSTSAYTVFSGCTNVKEVIFVGSQPNNYIPRMLYTLSQDNSDLIVRVPLNDLQIYQSYFNTMPGGASMYSWYQNLTSNSYSNESEIKFASTSDTLLYDDDDEANGLIESAIAQGWLKYNTRTFTLYDAQKVTNRNMNRDNQVNGVEILSRDDNSYDRDFEYSRCNKKYHGLKNFNAFQYFTNVTEIPNSCFKDSTQLTSIKLPNTITKIGDYAFSGCTSLGGSITLGDSVTTIGNYAFQDCYEVTSVTIGRGVTSIGNAPFFNCDSDLHVTFNAINCSDLSESGFTGDDEIVTSLTIGNEVTRIPNNFMYCSRITTLTIPNNVRTIGDKAFYDNYDVSSITIGTGVTSIGSGAFRFCGNNANKCTVTINATTPPTLGDGVFDSNYIKKIYVPVNCGDIYENAQGWSSYSDFIEEQQ